MPIHFYIGNDNKFLSDTFKSHEGKQLDFIKKKLSNTLDITTLSFLVGAGCSSKKMNGKEISIPLMLDLAKEFNKENANDSHVKLYKKGVWTNIEDFLGYLYRKRQMAIDEDLAPGIVEKIDDTITRLKKYIIAQCIKGNNKTVEDFYKTLFRKLMLRSSNLPRVNIFSTNYDLYSERALDDLGILYCNGFSGVVERVFNPSIYNYGMYKELDIKSTKLIAIDNFINLFKLHGSINWIRSEKSKFFNIKETQQANEEEALDAIIYPTPQKHEDSLGTPYSDLFREFQRRLMQNDNILVCIGYSFSDDHINNIIFQALTIPTFRLIIFSSDTDDPTKPVCKLKNLNDSRIWIIGGDYQHGKLHYFEYFIKDVLPDLQQEKIDLQIKKNDEELMTFYKLKADTEVKS